MAQPGRKGRTIFRYRGKWRLTSVAKTSTGVLPNRPSRFNRELRNHPVSCVYLSGCARCHGVPLSVEGEGQLEVAAGLRIHC